MLDEVQPEAGELTLLADARIGQPDRRHQVAVAEHRKNLRVDLVGLACQRRETLDLLRSAISTDQPSCSRVSCTILAPVIDSITAETGWQWTSSMRRANLLSESTSGATASWSRCSP